MNSPDTPVPLESGASTESGAVARGAPALTAPELVFDQARFFVQVQEAVDRMASAACDLSTTQIARLREFGPSIELLHVIEATQAELALDERAAPASTETLMLVARSQAACESSSIDRLTIEVVARVFEFILREPALAADMRAVIAGLQLPTLRAALIDREFFLREAQPARRLLDALCTAAVAWSSEDGTSDPLFTGIESAVQTVADEFHLDLALFDGALEIFSASCSRHDEDQQRAIGPSVARAAREEEFALVEPEVDRRLARRFELAPIDDTLAAFLRGPWRSVLVELCAARETDPEPWKQALNATDALIWSVLPKDNSIERRELLRSLPGIVEQVLHFLDRIHWHGAAREEFMKYLMEQHAVVARTRRGAQPPAVPLGELAPTTASPALDANSGQLHDGEQVAVPQAAVGDWFALDNGTNARLRCRLVWISPKRTRYVFVRRDGSGAFVKSDLDIRLMLRTGVLRKFDTSPIVTRALSAMRLLAP